MTIPIFLSEAIPLEIRNILKSLEIGMPVRFRSDEGQLVLYAMITLQYVLEKYLTRHIGIKREK